jgi:hypothetical protein
VPAVGADHGVALVEGLARADDARLLAIAEMRGAAHQVLGEEPLDLVLEQPDLDHPLEHREQLCVGRRALGGHSLCFRSRHLMVKW